MGDLPMTLALLFCLPAAILIGTVVIAKRMRPNGVGRLTPIIALSVTYPAWMFAWTAFVAIAGGMIGPCGAAPATPARLALFIIPPSLPFCWGLWSAFRSRWIAVAPLVADAAVLAGVGLFSQEHGTDLLGGFGLFVAAYAWVGTAAGMVSAWIAFTPRCSPGACGRCGYSLVDLPRGTRCPECGITPTRPARGPMG